MNISPRDFPNNSRVLPMQTQRSLILTRLIIFVFISGFILVGNTVCLAVFLRTRALRRRSYDLLISLSVADLLVGFSSVLLCVEDGLTLQGTRSDILPVWRDVSQYLPRMCSLFTVATVAVERFWAVGFPTKHRKAGKSPYIVLIATPWVLAAVLSAIYLASTVGVVSIDVFNYSDVVFSQLTLLTIIIAYCALLGKMRRNTVRIRNNHQRSLLKERKLAVTLFVVTLASLITIYPINIYFMVQIMDGHHMAISENLFLFLIALACCNSGINIIVYMFRIGEFKRALCRMCRRGGRHGRRVSCSTRGLGEGMQSQNNTSLVQNSEKHSAVFY